LIDGVSGKHLLSDVAAYVNCMQTQVCAHMTSLSTFRAFAQLPSNRLFQRASVTAIRRMASASPPPSAAPPESEDPDVDTRDPMDIAAEEAARKAPIEVPDQELVEMWNKNAPNGPEYGGPRGVEPTRHGDWAQKGRCTDF
jgi:hypothetical protein